MVDRVQLAQPAPNRRRLLVRVALFAFCGGLLLLLSSRPAEAAERREPGLLDPVSTTLKATAREVQLAGRATGSGASTVGKAADAARQAVAPHLRPAPSAARPPATPPVKRGAPAVTSPVRRVAPPTRPATPKGSSGPVGRVAKITSGPVGRVAKVASPVTGPATGPVGRVAQAGGRVLSTVARVTAPVAEVVGPVTGAVVRPLGPALAPVGSALVPVAGAAGGLVWPVVPGGLLPLPLPELPGSGTGSRGGSGAQGPAATSTGVDGTAPAATLPAISQTIPARPAADGASSHAARSIRSWPALTGAVSLPGFPASAELPAGGPDPFSTSSGAGFALAALTAALLLLGLDGRGRARPDRSGVISRSYLPAVSPA
jgi:hypothetical protein